MGTFTNSEDHDEMLHNAAFHQGLHCLLRKKKSSHKKYNIFLIIITGHPYIFTMDYTRVIVSNHEQEPISVQRVNCNLL